MDRTALSSPSPPSSCPTSGGTPTTLPQPTSHEANPIFLHDQYSHEPACPVSSDHSATVPAKNIEQQRSTLDSSFSSSPLSLSDTLHQSISPSLSSQRGLSESYTESSNVPPEQASGKSRNRARELSAPLPSVPPSTPASAVSHRSSFSTHANNPSVSPSFLRHGSPVFSSPLAELSDTEEVEQDVAELSDSNSIEIISGYVAHPFVPARYRNLGNNLQNVSQSPCSSYAVASSLPYSSPKSEAKGNVVDQDTVDLPALARTDLSASQTPNVSQSPPSTLIANEAARTVVNSQSASFIASHSMQNTPSRTLPQTKANLEGHLPSQMSCSVSLPTIEVHGHQPQGTAEGDLTQEPGDVPRTPNVYINGLPPHFPDESLYLMTRDFGHVLSVRTFTRCVGEKMSGYGFVLFDSIESAERCIDALRKYRNLHPSFSKQIHKIPGTPYASGTITLPPAGSLPSLTSQSTLSTTTSLSSVSSGLASSTSMNNLQSPLKMYGHHNRASVSTTSGSDFSGKDFKELTFREKMERLKDEKSTNLYMEGLPLTIDDVSLAALVSPHKVVSSRFFQTKLSDPPRMIAFVRLDTRTGAEEIIERLHGRVVRGWNDNGCRISVRFADTHEQRELRRSERFSRGEEEVFNNSQLSMAHAALLNLRGAEVQTQLGSIKLHQQQRSVHHDQRFPMNTTGQYLTELPLSASDLARKGFRASDTQDVLRGYGAHPSIQRAAPQYCYAPAPPRHASSSSPVRGAMSMGLFDGSSGQIESSALPKRSPIQGTCQSLTGVMTNSLGAGQPDLLQQRNQLQQLQLLRQMQKAGIDTNYAMEHRGLDEAFSLMPSVDITINQFNDLELHPATDEASAHDGMRRQQDCISRAPSQSRTHGTGIVSEMTDMVQTLSPIGEHHHGRHHGRHHASGQIHVHQDQGQHVAKQNSISPEFCYPSQFAGRGADHRGGTIINSRRTALDEGEVTLISPALTYASRTPSTLSPATPLFNTFGTPAAAPATVPRGKTNVREREYARLYKNELRQ